MFISILQNYDFAAVLCVFLILPIIAAIMFFGTTVMKSDVPDDVKK